MFRLRVPLLLGIAASLGLTACVTYTEELNRGQRAFQANEYEHALAIWRGLEDDLDSLAPGDRARYAYFRGMTDYRMSLRDDARHWLALAHAYDQATPGGIEDAWRERMKDARKDLANDMHGGGVEIAKNTGADAGFD